MSNCCGICWEEFTENDLIYSTKCKPVSHKFHIECLQISYKINHQKECPICRQNLNITNYQNLYPKCKYVLTRGKNKGNQGSKIGKCNGGYCHMHKEKINSDNKEIDDNISSENINSDNKEIDDNISSENINSDNKKYVLSQGNRCDAICKTGKQCKNRKKFSYFCGIHKNIIVITS